MIDRLIKLADSLDQKGLYLEANIIDFLIKEAMSRNPVTEELIRGAWENLKKLSADEIITYFQNKFHTTINFITAQKIRTLSKEPYSKTNRLYKLLSQLF